MEYAVLFPGQGSQFVGMGSDVFAARPDLLGATANDVLGWSLRDTCATGPEEVLTDTERAQPALYAVSYALWEAFSGAVDRAPAATAGHSLGEYTALAAAGSLDFTTGLRLVAARGRAMERAAATAASGMAALLGADAADAEAIAAHRRAEGGMLYVANLNAPGHVVVAGGRGDLEWLEANATQWGVRRVVPLKVSGGFHSPFMAGAVDELRAALAEVAFRSPHFPVYANVSAAPVDAVTQDLADQLVSTVRFDESLRAMAAAGVEAFVHVGPGQVTAGMAKRSVPDAMVLTVSSLDDVSTAAEALAVE
jgi:[acyl-carrier-protein] S-malonyltransferase